jgi:hypothetical protein
VLKKKKKKRRRREGRQEGRKKGITMDSTIHCKGKCSLGNSLRFI